MGADDMAGGERDINTRVEDVFTRTHAATGCLVAKIPFVAAACKIDLDAEEYAGWRRLKEASRSFVSVADKPLLVACLAGPSGAGKSTIFRLVTGLDVPAGDGKRPISHNSVVAIPDDVAGSESLRDLLPAYNGWRQLDDPDKVRDPGLTPDDVFYSAYSSPYSKAPLKLLLADIPDFNTVECSNWEKAEKMMAAADLVVFTVQGDSYKDNSVVATLRRCCNHAGALACILTKTEREPAIEKWDDLVAYSAATSEFLEERHDGRTLASFLAQSRCYQSPFSRQPALEEIRSINDEDRDLNGLLHGIDGAQVLFESRMQSIDVGVKSCRCVCDDARRQIERMRGMIADLEEDVYETALTLAQSEFPMGRLLEIIIDTERESRHWAVRWLNRPISLAGSLFMGMASWIKSMKWKLESLKKHPDRVEKPIEREELEKRRCREYAEGLVDKWRKIFPQEQLGTERCRAVLSKLDAEPLPPIGEEWDRFVRKKALEWIGHHPMRSKLTGLLVDLSYLAGGGGLVVDCLVGGFGTLTLVAWLSSGSLLASLTGEIMQKIGFRNQLLEADEQWHIIRGKELGDHLRDNLAAPLLLDSWKQKLRMLQEAPLEQCIEACNELDKLKEEFGNAKQQ